MSHWDESVFVQDEKIRDMHTAPLSLMTGTAVFFYDKIIRITGVLLYENDYILYNFIEILSLLAVYYV